MTDEATHDEVTAALLQTLPVVVCPPNGAPPPFASADMACRLVVANDGVWLEARTAAIHAALKVLQHGPHLLPSTPFGNLAPEDTDLLVTHLQQPDFDWFGLFLREARARWPNECAGFVIFDAGCSAWRLAITENSSVSGSHVRYRPPRIYSDEVVVIDIHSHGAHRASFSSDDDADDRADAGSLKLAFVLGRVHTEQVDVASRLVAFGCLGPTTKVVRDAPSDAAFESVLA